ncbi:MAG: helix-turn-helix domain-containing protein [Pseudomonadota bacterium]
MSKLFDPNRTYVLGDPELELLGSRDRLAQWRHKGSGPAYYKLGRKILYHGVDLNAWVESKRTEPETL